MTLHDISRLREFTQHIGGTRSGEVKNLVSYLGAMQAQDYSMAKWAAGVRISGSTENIVEQAINRGDIIRTHLLRPTWHMVSADDIHWILELTAPHIKRSMTARHKELEITGEILTKSNRLIINALSGNRQLTREELVKKFEDAGIVLGNNRAAHLLLCAELDGFICSGATRGRLPTYALLSERVPLKSACSRDEALARLALRYFTSHGPATLQDFTWWSGLPAGDAREALNMVKPSFSEETLDSETYWMPDSLDTSLAHHASAFLLPAFDEFLISYKDRRASLPEGNQAKAVSSNGIFRPVIVADGQVVGIWKKINRSGKITVALEYFKKPPKTFAEKIDAAVHAYQKFLGSNGSFHNT
jgi:hypothetical protein